MSNIGPRSRTTCQSSSYIFEGQDKKQTKSITKFSLKYEIISICMPVGSLVEKPVKKN